jgi:hypothetical protein
VSRLFAVEITIEAVIEADDFDHAHSVLSNNISNIVSEERHNARCDVSHEVTSKDTLPPGWELHCLPYGDDYPCNEHCIGYLLDNPPPSIPTPDTATIDMFDGAHSAEGGNGG